MAREINLVFDQAGEGSPPIVFVHGFASGREDWRPQMAHFEDRHTVVACDLRGHGESPRGTMPMTIETLAGDVVALMESLDLHGAVLVGHSMGCRIVLEARRQAAGRVAGLVLVDGSNVALGDKEGAQRRFAEGVRADGYADFVRSLFEDMFLEDCDPALRDRLLARALALPEAIGHPLFLNMMAWDADEAIRAMETAEVPALVLQSTAMGVDRVRRPLAAGESSPFMELARRHMPRVETEVVPGVGHFTMLEAPEAVNASIARFIATRLG